jgi:predicted alternative tryptophan synthase beta-subunit
LSLTPSYTQSLLLSVFTHVVVPSSIVGVKDLRKMDYMCNDDLLMTQDVCVACVGGGGTLKMYWCLNLYI